MTYIATIYFKGKTNTYAESFACDADAVRYFTEIADEGFGNLESVACVEMRDVPIGDNK